MSIKYYQKLKRIIRISFSLAKTNFSLRVEGSYLGIFWYLLSPLALFCVILFIKKVAFADTNIPLYPLYLLIGITGLNFFKQALAGSITAINSNAYYIKSINNIDPEILVLSKVIEAIFSHFFEFFLLAVFMAYYHVSLIGLLFYPIIFFFFSLLVLGISFIFATCGVYINDLDYVWLVVGQLLLLGTPIFYSATPGTSIYMLNLFNPLFYFLEVSRNLVIYLKFPSPWVLLIFIALSFSFLIVGISVFNKFKKKFAELV